jgi:hypothetical protein
MTTVSSFEINTRIGATFHNLSFDVPILIDGMSLTSMDFDRSHPVVLYQLLVY